MNDVIILYYYYNRLMLSQQKNRKERSSEEWSLYALMRYPYHHGNEAGLNRRRCVCWKNVLSSFEVRNLEMFRFDAKCGDSIA